MQERTARVGGNVDMTGSYPRSPRRTAVNLCRDDETPSPAATISSILESSTVDDGGHWHPQDSNAHSLKMHSGLVLRQTSRRRSIFHCNRLPQVEFIALG